MWLAASRGVSDSDTRPGESKWAIGLGLGGRKGGEQQQGSRCQPNASGRLPRRPCAGTCGGHRPLRRGKRGRDGCPSSFRVPDASTLTNTAASQPRQHGRDVDEAQRRAVRLRCRTRPPTRPRVAAMVRLSRRRPSFLFACEVLTLQVQFVSRSGRRRSFAVARCGPSCHSPFRPWLLSLMDSARAVLHGPAVRRHDVKECQRSVFGRPCRPSKPNGARQKSEEAPVGATRALSRRPDAELTHPGLQFDTKLPVTSQDGCGRAGGELGTGEGGQQTPRA